MQKVDNGRVGVGHNGMDQVRIGDVERGRYYDGSSRIGRGTM